MSNENENESIFIRASRHRLRFITDIGELSTEDLWDLPLTGRKSLEAIGNSLLIVQKSFADTSILSKPTGDDHRKVLCDLRVAIVRHIVRVKEAEIEAKTAEMARASEAARLDALISAREGAELPIETLKAQRAALQTN